MIKPASSLIPLDRTIVLPNMFLNCLLQIIFNADLWLMWIETVKTQGGCAKLVISCYIIIEELYFCSSS